MLVLRRKASESIVLDGTIVVSVLAVEGKKVKLGVSAPSNVSIVRKELLREKKGREVQDRHKEAS